MSKQEKEVSFERFPVSQLPSEFLKRVETAMSGLTEAQRIEVRRSIVNAKSVGEAEEFIRETLGLVRGEIGTVLK